MESKLDQYVWVLGGIGTIWLAFYLQKFLHFIFIYTRPSSLPKYHHSSNSGLPWAIVTGATDGIGKEFAHELALAEFNVVLHGRNLAKLQRVRHDLESEFSHLQFRVIQLDASFGPPESNVKMQEAVDSLRDLHITILINNVGTAMKSNGVDLEEVILSTTEQLDELINVNARFMTQFTCKILPLLLSHKGPALIMTLGSMAAHGMPNTIVYGAGKAFDLAFSRGLRRELSVKWKAVEVLAIQVAEVTATEHDRTPATIWRPTAKQFARGSLGMIGCGEEEVAGYWSHGILVWFMDIIPTWVKDWSVRVAMVKELEKNKRREEQSKKE